MKIAIISDTHFGFLEDDKEREYDPYINAKYALDYVHDLEVDIILMPGDLFDRHSPTEKTYERVFKLFSKYIGEQKLSPLYKDKTITKIPIIVIAGTHEFRGNEYKSPIDVLESAGYIYNLRNDYIEFSRGERVAISGMRGVPEKVASNVLEKLDFKPIPDAHNIFMLHQSFKEFLPFDDDMVATLKIEDLPKGFNLYIDGHIHLPSLTNLDKGKFLLPGSTILTQIKRKEVIKRKGFYIYDTKTSELEFFEIKGQREYHFIKIEAQDNSSEELYDMITNELNKLELNTQKATIYDKDIKLRPVCKIKLKGTILSGEKQSNIKEKDFEREDLKVIIDKSLDVSELQERIKDIDMSKEKDLALSKSTKVFFENLKSSGFKNSFDPKVAIDILKDRFDESATQEILNAKTKLETENDKKEVKQKTLF